MSNEATLFANVPKSNYLSLFDNEKLNYEKVIDYLEFKKAELAKITGVPITSIRYDWRIPKEVQERCMQWAVALELVAQFFKDANKAVLWFKIPNPMLGNVTPRDMIRVGRFKKLFSIIQNSLNDNKRD